MPAPSRETVQRSLDEHELTLHYQPIHDIATARVVSVEALLRWKAPEEGTTNAAPIAETAERSDQIFELDAFVMRRAFCDAAEWQSEFPGVRLNINLSAKEFEDGDIVEQFDRYVGDSGVDPSRLSLEITEQSFIASPSEVVRVLRRLKDRGVELWLDDFGTGHSSPTHLQHFPVDGLKIPAEFVQSARKAAEVPADRLRVDPRNDPGGPARTREGDRTERAAKIARWIVALARDLGLRTVAEGVETEEDLAFLRTLGCDYVQGFLLSRAMTAGELTAHLRKVRL